MRARNRRRWEHVVAARVQELWGGLLLFQHQRNSSGFHRSIAHLLRAVVLHRIELIQSQSEATVIKAHSKCQRLAKLTCGPDTGAAGNA